MSLVSCVEHINAFLGYEFLRQSILEQADPRMRDLMEWHFAEEVEHRAVAFDLLQAVSPRYPVRVLGAIMTTMLFYLLLSGMAAWLLAQDHLLWRQATWRQVVHHLGRGHRMGRRTLGHLWNYLRPGFHPADLPGGDTLAGRVLARQSSQQPPSIVPMTART